MRKLITSSLALSLLVGAPSVALAQEPAAGDQIETMPEAGGKTMPDTSGPELPADPDVSVSPPSEPEAVEVGPRSPSEGPTQDVTASEDLTGAPVYDPNGEEIGTLVGFATDDAGVPQGTIEFGGFLGIATKDVDVPLELFSHGEDGQLIADLTEDDLYKMYEVARRQTGDEPES